MLSQVEPGGPGEAGVPRPPTGSTARSRPRLVWAGGGAGGRVGADPEMQELQAEPSQERLAPCPSPTSPLPDQACSGSLPPGRLPTPGPSSVYGSPTLHPI